MSAWWSLPDQFVSSSYCFSTKELASETISLLIPLMSTAYSASESNIPMSSASLRTSSSSGLPPQSGLTSGVLTISLVVGLSENSPLMASPWFPSFSISNSCSLYFLLIVFCLLIGLFTIRPAGVNLGGRAGTTWLASILAFCSRSSSSTTVS